jgi:hypothetical protein
MGAADPQVSVPTTINSVNSKPSVRKSKRRPKMHFHTNAWRLIDSEFDSLNALLSFTLEACCDLDGTNRHGSLPSYSEKDSLLSHAIAGQYVYCNPPWSLAVQCIEHIRTCHSKSPLDTKALIVLPNWPQINAATTGLRLLRQIPIDTPDFTKPSPLGKRHTVVKVLWPINYWVIDKDTSVKVSPPHVKSVDSPLHINKTNSKSEIDSHWLTTAAALTIMDPNQPKPLMKLPISIEQDSLQFHTNVLIDSATTLNFVSRNFLTRNNLLGKCIRGSKIVVRIANE